MKANELRIGNWVKYRIYDEMDTPKEYDAYSKIEAEDLLHLQQYPDDEDFKPVPLTCDIFKMCGFKLKRIWNGEIGDTDITYFEKNGVCVTIQGRAVAVLNESYIPFGRTVAYLHQLQNLYFALTGEEL